MANKKNYRKFAVSSMAATAAVAAIAPAVSAAEFEGYSDVQAGDSHYEGIKALTEQGVIHGYEDGSFGINDNVTRQQVAVMLSLALDLETPSDVAGVLDVYSDVDENSLYAEEIAAVTAADIFNGNNGEFNPGDDITREQMATVLVLGLDLVDYNTDGNVDVNLDNVSASHDDRVQIFANLGITNQLDDFNPEEALTRGQFATFLHLSQDVLTATPNVKGVSAINAKQVEVNFSKSLDADSVFSDVEAGTLVDGVVTIDVVGDANDYLSFTGELSEDGKTLTLTAEDVFEGRYSMTIIGAKDTTGTEVESYAGFFTSNDVTAPTISGTERVNPTSSIINFSEPLASEGLVSFKYADGTDVEGATFTLDGTGSFGTVDLSAATVKANEKISVQFIGTKDFVGNLLTPNPASITVLKGEKDGVAPTVSSLSVTSPNQFEVKFSEEVQGLTNDDFAVAGALVTDVKQSETDKTHYTVTLDTSLSGVKTVTLNSDAVTDLSGEANAAYSKVVEFVADEVAPVLSSSTVITDTEDGKEYLALTFSKSVTITDQAIVLEGSKVKDYVTTEGVDVTIPANALVSVDESTTTYRVALSSLTDSDAADALVKGATYTLSLPADVATNVSGVANKAVAGAIEFTRGEDTDVSEVTAQTVETVLAGSNNSQVVADFGKAVDGATATNVANYSIDGTEVVKAEILNSADTSIVTLTLKEGATTFTGERNWTISNVEAADGGVLSTVAKGTINLTENIAPVVTSSTVTGENTIELTFSEDIKDGAILGDDFDVYQGRSTTALIETSEVITDNKVVITLTSPLDSLDDIVVEASSAIDISDVNSNATNFEEVTVK